MQLSVQQIIAKVAVQRQRQKKAQKQQQLLKQINLKQSDVRHPRLNHSKNVINSAKAQPDITIITQKYKQLQALYKKLKIQVSAQVKMDKTYGQVMEKLTKIIEKNSKLQTELDGLRMKRSVIVENEKSLNEENEKRNKSKKWMVTEYVQKSVEKSGRGRRSVDIVGKCEECCECEDRRISQNKNGVNESKKSNKLKVKQENTLQFQQRINTTLKTQTQDLAQQILQYKYLIEQKQSSINKLHFILEKQQELIKYYEASQINIEPKAGQIRSKAKQARQPSGRKVEGTIVKVKRERNGTGGQMGNKAAITDRRQIFTHNHYHFLSPTYIQANQQKTRKKPQIKNLSTNKTMQLKKPISQTSKNRLYTYIPSIPSQQQSNNTNPHYFYQQYYSPSSSINETSEFVCGELE